MTEASRFRNGSIAHSVKSGRLKHMKSWMTSQIIFNVNNIANNIIIFLYHFRILASTLYKNETIVEQQFM